MDFLVHFLKKKLLKKLRMQLKLNSNFYFINKPKTWTSQDLCTKFKKIYNLDKVGHSGTLDPNAEGAMLIATNKYTKLFDYISNKEKTYVVKSLFGYDSETLDIDSEFKKIHNINLNQIKEEFSEAVNNKLGESFQIPPKYSAIKVKGKRLYKYAREGREIDIPKRKINVKEIEILSLNKEKAEIKVKVSEGTYIRSLISYQDGDNFSESVSTSPVLIITDQGDASFEIHGTNTIGQTLSIRETSPDPDGTGTLSYSWQLSDDGINNWSELGTDATYTISADEEGKYIRSVISYQDGDNFSESVSTSTLQFPKANADPSIENKGII